MSLQHLSFDSISEAELVRLVTDSVGESKTLEYKEMFMVRDDAQKQEFLSDISALANTDGGDFLLGMKAIKGVAADLVGLKNLVPDDCHGRIENLLRDSLHPRVSGIQIKTLALTNGNHATIIRVPRSFAAPHMVRHQGITRFCGRNSSGKYDLDVHQLRSAFLANDTLSERLKAFRIERINRLLSGNSPVRLVGEHLLVFHLLPIIGGRADSRISTPSLNRLLSEHTPQPIGAHGWGPSLNFDGLLVTAQADKEFHAYVQVMRTGFIESVEALTLEPKHSHQPGQPPMRIIPGIAWEQRIIKAVPSYIKSLEVLGLQPPYVASLSLLNVRGYTMYAGPGHVGNGHHPVDRDHLLTDEILIESTTESPERLLRPLFDQVWNACGWLGSINYDDAGNWIERH